jgi:hypothetical protein
MTNVKGLVVGVLVVGLLVMAAVPASAQQGDPLRLASSGVLLPFFSDGAAGFVSILEIVSPVVPTTLGFSPPFNFTNPLHAVFFQENCARNKSIADVETAKQAKAFITSASPLTLNFNGLAAIANTLQGNDLIPLNFPIHSRTHWIDVKTGRLRELEPITLDMFLTLNAAFLPLVENPGAGASIGRCNFLTDALGNPPFSNGFCWNPLSSALTFVTPQESASIAASAILICPTSDIQSTTGGGVFPIANGFPRMVNRDGSFGFSARSVITGNNVTTLRGRIYNDDESGPKDILVPCTCLSTTALTAVDSIYSTPPANLGAHTVPVWYTELESQAVTANPVTGVPAPQHFSFTGYWNLTVTGHEGTLFHRMSSASLDNLSFGFNNAFGNR